MGCTGACQPVLGLGELDREIAWGLRNPWSTGLVDVLEQRPVAAVPRLVDLERPGAAEPFLRHGLRLVGIADGGPFVVTAHHGLRVFPYARVPVPGVGRTRLDADLRRLLASDGDVFVMLDLAALPPAPGAAAPLIETLAERVLGCGRRVVPLAEVALDAQQYADRQAVSGAGSWRLFPAIPLRRRIASVERARQKRRRHAEETRDLLARLSAATPDPPSPPPEAPRRYTDRGLIAHMQGETTLAGAAFDVCLAGGRFCGLVRGREALTPQRPAGSWVRAGGRTIAARGRSAFSFEGDGGTGLREDLVLEPGGSLVVDYAFRADDAVLTVEGSWIFPGLSAGAVVEEWAPLVLALADLAPGQDIGVDFEAPDGSTGASVLAERDGWRTVAGSRFRVKAGDREVLLEARGGAPAWGSVPLPHRALEARPARPRGESRRRRRSRAGGVARRLARILRVHDRSGEAMSRDGLDLFDVDHTITRHSTGGRFIMRAIARGLVPWHLAAMLPWYGVAYRLGLLTPQGPGGRVPVPAGRVAGRPRGPRAPSRSASACAAM